jgi:hypothetical protein
MGSGIARDGSNTDGALHFTVVFSILPVKYRFYACDMSQIASPSSGVEQGGGRHRRAVSHLPRAVLAV